MSEITSLDDLVAGIMPDVIVAIPTVTYELSTRALPVFDSPPRVVWVPSRDRWGAGQKRPRGGLATGKALATVMAGVDVHCWGVSRAATWALVGAVVRALRRRVGPEPFLRIDGGAWYSTTGATTLGEAYVLQLAVALDVPALPDPPTTTPITDVALDSTRSTAGDGFTDAGETG